MSVLCLLTRRKEVGDRWGGIAWVQSQNLPDPQVLAHSLSQQGRWQ